MCSTIISNVSYTGVQKELTTNSYCNAPFKFWDAIYLMMTVKVIFYEWLTYLAGIEFLFKGDYYYHE